MEKLGQRKPLMPLYGKKRIRKNLYSGIIYAVWDTKTFIFMKISLSELSISFICHKQLNYFFKLFKNTNIVS